MKHKMNLVHILILQMSPKYTQNDKIMPQDFTLLIGDVALKHRQYKTKLINWFKQISNDLDDNTTQPFNQRLYKNGLMQDRCNSIANTLELHDSTRLCIDGLVQERHNSIANAMELCLSCTNPWISCVHLWIFLPICMHKKSKNEKNALYIHM